ncbi:hypothetical protein BV25DRAFT_1720132 [Artomyces pyxidatus]|uniref:Uncharacterized protein n=1 Tax=Artomyces pyxidatus TaxID=48021 RepID=A0ACB8SI11_9AGAM|nr:hypothetical protein BV25DRAFT_1720132 [Artomyces pyxidatus]
MATLGGDGVPQRRNALSLCAPGGAVSLLRISGVVVYGDLCRRNALVPNSRRGSWQLVLGPLLVDSREGEPSERTTGRFYVTYSNWKRRPLYFLHITEYFPSRVDLLWISESVCSTCQPLPSNYRSNLVQIALSPVECDTVLVSLATRHTLNIAFSMAIDLPLAFNFLFEFYDVDRFRPYTAVLVHPLNASDKEI